MHNHDILIRLRYALDLKNKEVLEIFQLGGEDVTIEEVREMLTKPQDDYEDDDFFEYDDGIVCTNQMLESFLNGLITYKRGKQDPKPGQTGTQPPAGPKDHVNNMLLKKVKIALTSEDVQEILHMAGVNISKGELGAILRKAGHRNYHECGDRYARNFLKGLTLKYRG